jgi:flagellar biosynthesis regulator FlbT
MLKLLRYSQLIALAVLFAVVLALSLLYRGLLFDSLVQSETHASVVLSKTFANAIWPSHARFVMRAGALDRATLAGREEIAALDLDLRRLADGLSVVKVKIYDLNGLTVYSTDPRQIGQDASQNPGFQRARDGYAISNLTLRRKVDSWEGEISERHILATYVPVHVYDAAPVEAVLEVYNDVTELVEATQASQWKILAAVLGAMVLIYFVLQAILMDPQNAAATHILFRDVLASTTASLSNETVVAKLNLVQQLVGANRIFEALRTIRGLFPIERAILEGVAAQPPRAA